MCATVHQLSIGQLHVHHPVVSHASHAYHQSGRNHVEHHLLCCSAFHTTASGHKLWSHNGLDGIFRNLSQRGGGVAGDASCEQSVSSCFGDGTYHVWSGTAGSYSYERVQWGRLKLLQVFPSLSGLVLSILHGISECCISTCYQAYHQRGQYPEGRWQFAGIQYAQSSTCTCTGIEHAASLLHSLLYLCDKSFYLW